MTHFLVTGTAGFIGFHLARRLLADGHTVTGFDGMTPYYDVRLKAQRLALLEPHDGFRQVTGRLEDRAALDAAAALKEPDVILHLAAQAGVRYSLENPGAYVESNLVGSWNVLELARALQPKHLLLASTSSIYGANYAASKKSMELMAHSYAHLYGVPTTAFRFFTVYGPWGRPDMAPIKFSDAILSGRPIDVYGEGRMSRDFTYIDDIVEAIVRLVDVVPREDGRVTAPGIIDTLSAGAPFRTVNIGGGQPVGLMTFIETIEKALGRPATRNYMPMQPGDVPRTFASTDLLTHLTGFVPRVSLEDGIAAFAAWYREWRAH
jgi:UDP-glucuronate 4-epimerase